MEFVPSPGLKGAVCGQIAGACYGLTGIPGDWVEKLAKRDLIESLAERLMDGSA